MMELGQKKIQRTCTKPDIYQETLICGTRVECMCVGGVCNSPLSRILSVEWPEMIPQESVSQ